MSCGNFEPVSFIPKDSGAAFYMDRFKKHLSKLDDEQLMAFSNFVEKNMHNVERYLLEILAPEELSKDEHKSIYFEVLSDCNGLNLIDQLIKERLESMGIREW